MSKWVKRMDGGPGWGAQEGRWYIIVDHHMVGYVQQLPPPAAKGFHGYRVAPGAPVGDYSGTWKTIGRAAEVLASAAAGDVPITDDMVAAALQGHADYTDEAGKSDEPGIAHEAMRAALRRAAPLLFESHALTATHLVGVPHLTHEIRAKIEHVWRAAKTPEDAISQLVTLGVFVSPEWVLKVMAETEPTSGAPGVPPVDRKETNA